MTAFRAGQTVGRYRILRPLGSGAMGEVFLAQDPQIERLLAIKTVRMVAEAPEAIEEHTQRLLREAKTAGRLIHPHIVTLFDAGEEEGTLFLAFEYVEGRSLAQRLAEGPPPTVGEALRIACQAAEGLGHAHRHGIVHRDVKPGNVLLRGDGQVKVSDFGIAKMAGQSTELTVTGSVVGSPQYLSPEQIRGDELDGRSDLFSLGVVLYEMVGGRRPFDGDTFTTLLYKILNEPPAPVRLRPGLDPALSDLLGRMLAKEPERRPPTADSVSAELAELAGSLDPELLAAPAAFGADESAAGTALPTRPGEPPGEPAAIPPPPPPAAPAPGRADATAAPPRSAPVPATPSGSTGSGGSRRTLGLAAVVAGVLVVAAIVVVAIVGSRMVRGEGDLLARLRPAAVAPEASAEARERAAPEGGETAADVEPAGQGGEEAGRAGPRAPEPEPAAAGEGPTRGGGDDAVRVVADETGEPRPVEESAPVRQDSEGVRDEPGSEPSRPAAGSGEAPALSPGARRLEQVLERRPAIRRAARELAGARGAETTVDQRIRSGLRVALRVQPSTAFVLVDGTVIGRAAEFDPTTGGSPYALPGEGDYLVKLRAPGMVDHRVLVRASSSGPDPAVVSARLDPSPAAELDLGDLRLYRVREAVGFDILPPAARPGARLSVDGEPAGRAADYPGRFARGRTWLRLEPGRHRISVVAPGFERRDVAVEVSSGAAEGRERIAIRLRPDREPEP